MEKFLKWSAGLMVLALILAACQPSASGSPSEAPESAAPTASAAAQDPAEVCAADEYGCVEIPEGEPLHIAFWGVLSGADASLGEDSRRGVELAAAEIGNTLVGHEILLTTEDGLCTPEGGAAAAQRLAADPTIVGLVGSSCSDETVGGIQAITEAGLTTISSSNTRPALTAEDRGPEYAGYLRTAHSDSFQGLAVAEFAIEQGYTTAATIHDGSAYAQALQQVFADSFTELGGEIVLQDAIERGQTDMVPVLTRVAAEAPDFLYYPIFIAEGGFITSQVRGVPGLEDTVLAGSDGMFSPDFITAAGPNAEGMYLSSPDFTAFAAEYADLVALYEETFGETPLAVFHAHAFDAANMLFAAIEEVAMEADGVTYIPRGGLREALFATTDFEGLTGTLTCSPSGDCGAPVIGMYQITADVVADPTTLTSLTPVWPE
jgi:branched-chain amino acid transport system substrate-binding protein